MSFKPTNAFYPIILILLAGPISGADADTLLQGVQAWLDDTRDLEGRFHQSLASGALGEGLEETGKLYVARPGRMRWEYLSPERKVALLDDDRTWLYVEDDEELTLGRLDPEAELLPALFTGTRRLDQEFRAEVPQNPASRRGERLLRLVPEGTDEGLEEVVLTLGRRGYEIRAAEVLDAAGNRMKYRFSEFKRNVGLPEQLFEFSPPPGTLVVGEH
jgi:outer membrane lipoprotein carrier protein